MDRKQIEEEMAIHEAKMKALAEGRDVREAVAKLAANGVVHTSDDATRSAWDWKPDPRATAALQKPSHELAPDGPQQDRAKGQDKGIDL